MRRVWLGLWACLLAGGAMAAPAGTPAAEAAGCAAGGILTWPDGQDRPAAARQVRLVYRHAGAPPWFDEALVLGAVQRAATAWARCGLPAEVVGEAAAAAEPAGVIVVQWNDAATLGNFALAHLGERRLSLSAAMFRLLAERNPRHPAAQALQMALSHEMGHFFGLIAHSRRCGDVMSYYHDGRGRTCVTSDGSAYRAGVEYRAQLPTACDIARCRAVNGIGK